MTTRPGGRAELARTIDHTLLRPEATTDDVRVACREAVELGVAAVCVSASRVALAVQHAEGLPVAAVVGFPSGAHRSATKAHEARLAVEDGAAELDMVIDLGAAMAGTWSAVQQDIATVRDAAPRPTLLKVILETGLLGPESIEAGCLAAEAAGADFVKTSTGFSPAGGASVQSVRRMAATVGGRLGIKASGGIRTADQALAMVEAGATRLGLSATRAVLDGLAP